MQAFWILWRDVVLMCFEQTFEVVGPHHHLSAGLRFLAILLFISYSRYLFNMHTRHSDLCTTLCLYARHFDVICSTRQNGGSWWQATSKPLQRMGNRCLRLIIKISTATLCPLKLRIITIMASIRYLCNRSHFTLLPPVFRLHHGSRSEQPRD